MWIHFGLRVRYHNHHPPRRPHSGPILCHGIHPDNAGINIAGDVDETPPI